MPIPFQHKIDEVEKQLGLTETALSVAQSRYTAKRKAAFVAHNQQVHAQEAADARRGRKTAKAHAQERHFDAVAGRKSVVAQRNHARAQYWLGEIKRRQQIVHGLEVRDHKLEEAARHYEQTHGLHVVGNKVEGFGKPFEKWLLAGQTAVSNCSNRKLRNFYSMTDPGFRVEHCILGGPHHGERWDCSLFVTGLAWSCGFDDPNGTNWTGGFTGTLLGGHGRWHETSLHGMIAARQPGFIVYGSGDGHHTEAWCPAMDGDKMVDPFRTAGHGSPPVDFGTVHLFGSGEVERYFTLAS
jgi:hypothetical protein